MEKHRNHRATERNYPRRADEEEHRAAVESQAGHVPHHGSNGQPPGSGADGAWHIMQSSCQTRCKEPHSDDEDRVRRFVRCVQGKRKT